MPEHLRGFTTRRYINPRNLFTFTVVATQQRQQRTAITKMSSWDVDLYACPVHL